MSERKHPRSPWGSLQPRAEDVLAWGDLTPEDFRPAGAAEKSRIVAMSFCEPRSCQ